MVVVKNGACAAAPPASPRKYGESGSTRSGRHGHDPLHLDAERVLGRVASGADVDTLATTLIGAGHLLFADGDGAPPDADAVHEGVITVIAGVVDHPSFRSQF